MPFFTAKVFLEGIVYPHKRAKLSKNGAALKSMDEKSCEIKGGGQAAMMLMLNINIIVAICHHHCSHLLAATFDLTTFFIQAF